MVMILVISTNRLFWRINTLRPIQNGRHSPDDISICIFLNENCCTFIKTLLKFVPTGQSNNIPALAQIMACRLVGAKPLSEPVVFSLLTHICVTRPQWVNSINPREIGLGSKINIARIICWALLSSCEGKKKTSLEIVQNWFRQMFGAIGHQGISWNNVDKPNIFFSNCITVYSQGPSWQCVVAGLGIDLCSLFLTWIDVNPSMDK